MSDQNNNKIKDDKDKNVSAPSDADYQQSIIQAYNSALDQYQNLNINQHPLSNNGLQNLQNWNNNVYDFNQNSNNNDWYSQFQDQQSQYLNYNQQLINNYGIKKEFKFRQNNPFLAKYKEQNKNINFKEIAWQLMISGKIDQVLLALQAHLSTHQQDSQTWRILGKFYQQADLDDIAILCFQNSLKYNPQNLDTLLSLGVSSVNQLDSIKGCQYLKQWITHNSKYKNLKIDPNIVPDAQAQIKMNFYTVKQTRQKMIAMLEKADKQFPKDPQLLSVLALLKYIENKYEQSMKLFEQALKFDQTNYMLINKIGAVLANDGKSKEATQFYDRALKIRPNCPRIWGNYAISYSNLQQHQKSIETYLITLQLSPLANHIWQYIGISLAGLSRFDLVDKINEKNLQNLKQFKKIDIQKLPKPQIQYSVSYEQYVLRKKAKDWISE